MSPIFAILFIPLLQFELTAAKLLEEKDDILSTRIVNGFPATSIVPHQVSFRYNNSHFCGGSIINNRWILTAAHCMSDFDAKDITAVVGTIYLDQGGDEYNISKIVNHENYRELIIWNDIALVQVDREFEHDKGYGPIALCEKSTKSKTPMRLNGWGLKTTSGIGHPPNNLQSLDTNTISNFRCMWEVLTGIMPPINFNKVICTVNEKGTGACRGDSGGGLVDRNTNQLCGVVSWGKPCAKGKPDVFTRVYSYKDWIDNVIKKPESEGFSISAFDD